MSRPDLAAKRVADVAVSSLLLTSLMPLWAVCALAVKLSSPGPVFFIQKRPGYHGQSFAIFKFRTMKLGSDRMVKGQEVMRDDDRITSVGRFFRRAKIDEVPQILNVLKGDMSLVGPRPERIASLEDYDERIARRLDMLPGMTGLAQVSGNIYLSLEDRYKYDVYYVDHYSLPLDIRILARTVGVVVRGEERYKDNPLVPYDEVARSYEVDRAGDATPEASPEEGAGGLETAMTAAVGLTAVAAGILIFRFGSKK